MKIVLHSNVASPSLIGRYRFAAQVLREAGYDSVVRTGVAAGVGAENGDLLVSHNWISQSERVRLEERCFGGREMTRPQSLELLESLGYPTMEWTTVSSQEEALQLFGSWNVDKLILKRSFTGGGMGFHVFTPNQPSYAEWNFEQDVICKEVNPNCGLVYKAELFGGELMFGFVLKKEAIGTRLCDGDESLTGSRQLTVYRNPKERPDERHRALHEFSADEREALETLAGQLATQGFGYMSLDLMRKPDGQLVAIELNTGSVTTWWSEQFPFVRERFATSLLNLVEQN